MKLLNKKFIFIYIVLLIILYLLIYTLPRLTGYLTSSYTLEYGDLKVYDESTGYIVRNETVYLADKGGQINRLIKGGTLVRKATNILEISGHAPQDKKAFDELTSKLEKRGVTATGTATAINGILSYNVDGMEGAVTPENMLKLKRATFEDLETIKVQSLEREDTSAKDPIFRIVDQSKWYIVAYIDLNHKDRYQEGNQVTIEAIEGKKTYSFTGSILSNTKEGQYCKLIIETADYYKGFADERSIKINVVASNRSGLVILNKSITKQKGQQGLYVKNKLGKYYFVPIKVISTDGEKSIVAKNFFFDEEGQMVTTVKAYDIVKKSA